MSLKESIASLPGFEEGVLLSIIPVEDLRRSFGGVSSFVIVEELNCILSFWFSSSEVLWTIFKKSACLFNLSPIEAGIHGSSNFVVNHVNSITGKKQCSAFQSTTTLCLSSATDTTTVDQTAYCFAVILFYAFDATATAATTATSSLSSTTISIIINTFHF